MPYSLLSQAIRYAAEKHDGQFRDGDNALPYIIHPMEVLMLLRHVGGVTDEDMLCAAALHDVLEETSTPPSEIEQLFGGRTSSLVIDLTREEPTPAQTAGMSKDEIWQLRANMLLAEIKEMKPEVQCVKLADRLANVRDAKLTKKGEKLSRYIWQTKKILEIVPKSVNPALWKAIAAEIA